MRGKRAAIKLSGMVASSEWSCIPPITQEKRTHCSSTSTECWLEYHQSSCPTKGTWYGSYCSTAALQTASLVDYKEPHRFSADRHLATGDHLFHTADDQNQ